MVSLLYTRIARSIPVELLSRRSASNLYWHVQLFFPTCRTCWKSKESISNQVSWHSCNSPTGAWVTGDRLGREKFPFDERVMLHLLCFFSEKDSRNLYLHDCLVAVIPEGLCHFCNFLQVCILIFYCWKIETWETAPVFLTIFYKHCLLWTTGLNWDNIVCCLLLIRIQIFCAHECSRAVRVHSPGTILEAVPWSLWFRRRQ